MRTLEMRSRFARLLQYSAELAGFSETLFVILLSALGLGLSTIVGYSLVQLGFDEADRFELFRFGPAGFMFIALIFAPTIETLLFQQLPILVMRRFGLSAEVQFAMGSIPFAVMHFSSGIITGLAAGVVGGVILSFVYLTFIAQSRWKAFYITALVHALQNLVPSVMYLRELP